MSLSQYIAFTGLLYLIGFSALNFIRQQGLSARFILEGLIFTLAGIVLSLFYPVSPILFLILIYLITMRVRVLVDMGNWFSARKDFRRALALYSFALRLSPDESGRLVTLISRGVTQLRMQDYEAAHKTLEGALSSAKVQLRAKYISAGYYNLGIACSHTGRDKEAIQCFYQATQVFPASVYARAAERALKERGAKK